MSLRTVDKLPMFSVSAKRVLDDALREGARDTLIAAKTKAPFKAGQLRGDTEVKAVGKLTWRVSFFKEYARFQEFGGDGKRTVRNYSASGTGKAYLKSSGDEQARRINMIFMKHGKRARA